jgi:7-cyano-7-deazaguanine reductase
MENKMDNTKSKGQIEIENAQLVPIPNRYPGRDYEIFISLPEFTCLCPMYGYPDFATINITYIPDEYIVELKSIKLYINKFRNEGIYHEEAINKIMDELIKVINPRWIEVEGDFNRRGNVKTVVTTEHTKEGYVPK